MRKIPLHILIGLVFLFNSIDANAQSSRLDALRERVKQNGISFQKNIDTAFHEIDSLIKEALSINDYSSELNLIERKCRYFYQKNLVDSLFRSSALLAKKAELYQNVLSRAMAFVYESQGLSINQMYDKALESLETAYKILENEDAHESSIFFAKSNILTSLAGVYLDNQEPEKAVEKLLEVIKSYDSLKNPDDIKKFQYLNYANIASVYVLFDQNLAEYYALESIAIKPDTGQDDKIMMMNYSVLGKVNNSRGNYENALNYYHKAIAIYKDSGEELNIKSVYEDMVELYAAMGRNDSSIVYENRLKGLEITMLQSKYNSLSELIDRSRMDEMAEQPSKSYQTLVIYGLVLLIIVLAIALFFYSSTKKNQNRSKEEIAAKHNLLINLIKENDPSFLCAFEEVYVDFSKKLLAINPKLSKSELEFCALLKLNLSTKEIAKLTFIETRTVQNKKYRIRRRLDIPSSVDIYNWFNSF